MSNDNNKNIGHSIHSKNIIQDNSASAEKNEVMTLNQIDAHATPTDEAYPINFRLVRSYADDKAVLHDRYEWDPSTGVKIQLGSCEIKSIVHYPGGNPFNPETPPFGYWNVKNPDYLGPLPAEPCYLIANSYCGEFTKPYKAAEFTVTQEFYYRQSWWPVEKFEKLTIKGLGDYIKIKHSVYKGSDGRWMYKVESPGGGVTAPI